MIANKHPAKTPTNQSINTMATIVGADQVLDSFGDLFPKMFEFRTLPSIQVPQCVKLPDMSSLLASDDDIGCSVVSHWMATNKVLRMEREVTAGLRSWIFQVVPAHLAKAFFAEFADAYPAQIREFHTVIDDFGNKYFKVICAPRFRVVQGEKKYIAERIPSDAICIDFSATSTNGDVLIQLLDVASPASIDAFLAKAS